jgi:hypothetical protein
MKTVLIDDMRSDIHVLAVDLRQILAAPGDRAAHSEWRLRDVWATGEDSAATLESLDSDTAVSGQRLRELSEDVTQIIDGVFSAFDSGSAEPWVAVEAVDSSYYLVRSGDPSVLDIIRNTFHHVSDYEPPVT